jgi:hypothetical protein
VVHRNVSLPVMWTTLKTSAKSAGRVASCREASVASRANLASVPSHDERGLSVYLFGNRYISNRNAENADDEQYSGAESDPCFGCKAGLGVGWP